MMERRRALMGAGKVRLPAEYQEVEWIGYYSSAKTLITSITCEQLTKVVADIAKTALPTTNNGTVFPSTFKHGQTLADTANWGTLENQYSSKFTASPVHARNELFTRTTITSTKGNPQSTNRIGIGYNSAGYCPALQFYSFRILNGETVLFDGVPCYRKSDSKIGMYDLISNHFVGSTGTWTKGADVT